ncbi:hypothetical protein RSAG8_03867, partial [Rhizoctonia solani AG-8 WAC10335]
MPFVHRTLWRHKMALEYGFTFGPRHIFLRLDPYFYPLAYTLRIATSSITIGSYVNL